MKGICDYFEDHLDALERHKSNNHQDDSGGNWYRLLPKWQFANDRIIQRLPDHKIEALLAKIREGSFTLDKLEVIDCEL